MDISRHSSPRADATEIECQAMLSPNPDLSVSVSASDDESDDVDLVIANPVRMKASFIQNITIPDLSDDVNDKPPGFATPTDSPTSTFRPCIGVHLFCRWTKWSVLAGITVCLFAFVVTGLQKMCKGIEHRDCPADVRLSFGGTFLSVSVFLLLSLGKAIGYTYIFVFYFQHLDSIYVSRKIYILFGFIAFVLHFSLVQIAFSTDKFLNGNTFGPSFSLETVFAFFLFVYGRHFVLNHINDTSLSQYTYRPWAFFAALFACNTTTGLIGVVNSIPQLHPQTFLNRNKLRSLVVGINLLLLLATVWCTIVRFYLRKYCKCCLDNCQCCNQPLCHFFIKCCCCCWCLDENGIISPRTGAQTTVGGRHVITRRRSRLASVSANSNSMNRQTSVDSNNGTSLDVLVIETKHKDLKGDYSSAMCLSLVGTHFADVIVVVFSTVFGPGGVRIQQSGKIRELIGLYIVWSISVLGIKFVYKKVAKYAYWENDWTWALSPIIMCEDLFDALLFFSVADKNNRIIWSNVIGLSLLEFLKNFIRDTYIYLDIWNWCTGHEMKLNQEIVATWQDRLQETEIDFFTEMTSKVILMVVIVAEIFWTSVGMGADKNDLILRSGIQNMRWYVQLIFMSLILLTQVLTMLSAQLYLGYKHTKLVDFIAQKKAESATGTARERADVMEDQCTDIEVEGLATVFWQKHFVYIVGVMILVVDWLYKGVWGLQ